MISQKQLDEWKNQSSIDIEQYQKDEKYLKQMEKTQDHGVRNFFERLRAKYFNVHTEQNDKLNRLLYHTQFATSIEKYPNLLTAYLTYNTSSILVLGICFLAPKKIISKIIISLVVYGLKTNIADGLFTYYMVEKMALGNNMTQQEQEIRNVLQFYYLHNKFRGKPMGQQEQGQTDALLQKIRKQSQKYQQFKRLQNIL